MKNLTHIDEDKLETLPSRERCKPYDVWFDYQTNYPWKKIHRFLISNVGQPWAEVCSKFIHLSWVPTEYRTYHHLTRHVEVNTFLRGNDVIYFTNYCTIDQKVEDSWGELLYVHPETKLLCHKQKKRIDYIKRRQEKELKTMRVLGDYHQLLKLNGIWYEVKGTPYDPVLLTRARWDKPTGPKDRMIKDEKGKYNNFSCYSDVKITLKHQLSHKELKHYGLTND